MAEQQAFIDAFQRRILLAAMGALPAIACSSHSAAPRDSLPSSQPFVSGDSSVASSSLSGSTAAGGSSAPLQVQASNPDCFDPFSTMRAMGTGEPAAKPAPSSFDKHGCLPFNEVSNGCCNGATAGPKFKDGKCCYDIPNGPCCGRPYIVDGSPRLAGIESNAGWSRTSKGREHFDHLNERTRTAIVVGWLGDARMEHASVASFARFVTDLMAVGAPSIMVRDAGMALLDEVSHAELCFGMASRFAETPLAPGPLSTDASSSERGIESIVESAVIEGCIGETVATLLAHRRLSVATDLRARAILERIVEDEARHAELAFRFVRWMLDQHGPVVITWVERAVAEASKDASLPGSRLAEGVSVDDYRSMGLLDPDMERSTIREAMEQVAVSAVRSMVDGKRVAASPQIDGLFGATASR